MCLAFGVNITQMANLLRRILLPEVMWELHKCLPRQPKFLQLLVTLVLRSEHLLFL